MKNKIIVPTGYMSSGSSAVTDLIAEFEGYESANGSFEYVFLHCPNGVFDLEDKLLRGNNAIRSDEALHSFCSTMRQLFDKKYWWVGNYNKIIGESFWKDTQDYIKELTQYQPDFYWYYQENTDVKMFFQLIARRIVRLLTLNKVELKKPLLYPQMWISYVTEEEFYQASKTYIYKVLNKLGLSEKNIILDQLLLPFNLFRIDNYFDDDIEVFVIERDPRDMFLMNKYIYPTQNIQVPYPTDVREFCECYRNLRKSEKACTSKKVHRFRFEDFIYRYDETVAKVQKILQSEDTLPEHVAKKKFFVPEKSINNTQLFHDKKYEEETRIIEQMLPEFLYDFPYVSKPDEKEMF